MLRVLLAVATELELERQGLDSVTLRDVADANSELHERLIVRTRSADHRLTKRTLVLDATADMRILNNIFAGEITLHDISVRRSGKVVQVFNVLMNKTKLMSPSGTSYVMKAQRVIDRLSRAGKRGAIFTYNDLEGQFVVPPGWAIDHFGNLRGTNSYKHRDLAVIVGRWALPPQVIEDIRHFRRAIDLGV